MSFPQEEREMSQVAGLPPTPGVRPALPRQSPPPSGTDQSLDPSPHTYRQVERGVEQERVDPVVGSDPALPRTGVEPVSTQSVLHLRQTAAPVARIAEAYGLAPAAVRRMLRAASGDEAAGPVTGTAAARD